MTYCTYINQNRNNIKLQKNILYHDNNYGVWINDDNQLFGRLILEINQAGLSWNTILNKQDNFIDAYDGFDINLISNYKEAKINELMQNKGIIRNKLKINATIHNANVILKNNQTYGSFQNWIESNYTDSIIEWVKIFKKDFKFVGHEIINEFLMSIGVLKGAHNQDCEYYKFVLDSNPMWYSKIKY